MHDCPSFQTAVKFMPSAEQHPSGQVAGGSQVVLAWCTHQPSAATERQVKTTIGGALLLICRGEQARCQVPPDLRTF